jgi:predicted deacylase
MVAIRRLADVLPGQLEAGRVTLIPVVNKPAFRRGERTAEDHLDLARTCPGRADGTVTERIAAALSPRIKEVDFYIDLHTGGTHLTVLPLVGYVLHPKGEVLAAQRRMAQAFGLPVIWGTDSNLNGRTLSVARDADVPAIYAEYLGGARCSPEGVQAYFEGCLRVLSDLEMLSARVPSPPTTPLWVEDDRPDSGHMQVQYPSEREGFFEPNVDVGEPVVEGELLGSVVDEWNENVSDVYARQSGIVLVLRTFPRVNVGDPLAVILDTSQTRTEEGLDA